MEHTTLMADSQAKPRADEAIIAAWEQHKAARLIYDALPFTDCPGEVYTPEERVQIAVMDETEILIRATEASTPKGVEIKLWIALGYSLPTKDESAAAVRADLDWFLEREADYDWIDRMTISAIRSLRKMGGEA